MSSCTKCGTSGKLIKDDGVIYCWDCYAEKSPVIDETWRIIKQSLDHKMVWVDIDAAKRKPTGNRRRMRR